jgi:hypothetical protein
MQVFFMLGGLFVAAVGSILGVPHMAGVGLFVFVMSSCASD